MAQEGLLRFNRDTKLVMIREDFVRICADAADPICAAVILNEFYYWFGIKHRSKILAQKDNDKKLGTESREAEFSYWVWKSSRELREETFEMFGINTVSASIKFLVDEGFLERRTNPDQKWDRTYQYLFGLNVVQEAIDNLTVEDINLSEDVHGVGDRESAESAYIETEKPEAKESKLLTKKPSTQASGLRMSDLHSTPECDNSTPEWEQYHKTTTKNKDEVFHTSSAEQKIIDKPKSVSGKPRLSVTDSLSFSFAPEVVQDKKPARKVAPNEVDKSAAAWIKTVLEQFEMGDMYQTAIDAKKKAIGLQVRAAKEARQAFDEFLKTYGHKYSQELLKTVTPETVVSKMWGGMSRNGWLFTSKALPKDNSSPMIIGKYMLEFLNSNSSPFASERTVQRQQQKSATVRKNLTLTNAFQKPTDLDDLDDDDDDGTW